MSQLERICRDPMVIDSIASSMWEANRCTAAELGRDMPPWEDETEALRDSWRGFARTALEEVQIRLEPHNALAA